MPRRSQDPRRYFDGASASASASAAEQPFGAATAGSSGAPRRSTCGYDVDVRGYGVDVRGCGVD
eukprot:1155136-Pyramimonas_sp.AAC.1